MNTRITLLFAISLIFLAGCVPYGYAHKRGYYGGHSYHGYRQHRPYYRHHNTAYGYERCDNY